MRSLRTWRKLLLRNEKNFWAQIILLLRVFRKKEDLIVRCTILKTLSFWSNTVEFCSNLGITKKVKSYWMLLILRMKKLIFKLILESSTAKFWQKIGKQQSKLLQIYKKLLSNPNFQNLLFKFMNKCWFQQVCSWFNIIFQVILLLLNSSINLT